MLEELCRKYYNRRQIYGIAEEKGMQVIFCAPTAKPPAWLTEKYPEVLNADMDSNLYRHGSRRHIILTVPSARLL